MALMSRLYKELCPIQGLIHKKSFLGLLKTGFIAIASFVILCASASTSFGQATFRTQSSGNWTNSAIWVIVSGTDGDGVPDSNDDVIVRGGFEVTINGNSTCSNLQIGGIPGASLNNSGTVTFGGAFTLTVGNSVTVGGYGNTFWSGTLNFISNSTLVASNLTFGNSGATPGNNNEINMTAGGTLRVGSFTVNTATITNTWIPGTGTVEMTATNTLPALDIVSFNNLTVNGGTTSLGASVPIAGTLRVDAGSLAMGAMNITSVNAINMTGTTISGTGTITLAGNVTTNAAATASTISANINVGGSTRTFNVDDTAAIPDLNVSGVISGTGGIVKTGIGSMNLSNASNSYNGSTTANQGILRIAAAGGSIPNGSSLIVDSTLDLNGNSETVGSISGSGTITSSSAAAVTLTVGGDNLNTNFSGLIQNGSSTGVSLSKQGTGDLTLSSANTYSGGTLLSNGGINVNNPTSIGTGTFTIAGGNIDNTSGGTITLTNNNLQNWNSDFVFVGSNSLNLGTGTISMPANRQITVNSNTLTVGGVINAPTFTLTKSGAGNLNLGSNNITLNGLTINAGGFTSTSSTLFLAGNFSSAGTFNHNSGTVHYNGAVTQTIANVTYHNLITSGAGQKNASGTITVNNNLTNSTILDMGENTLTVSGTIDNTGGNLRFTGATNGLAVNSGTVTYYGASQTITSGTYNNLVINQSSGQASLGGNVTVNGTLTLTNGVINLSGFNLTLGPSATISVASPSATRMIIANGSQVIKTYSGAGSFLFPIGDNTGTTEYSPITVNVTAGSGFPANVGVTVVDAKHPNNSSTADFLTRYWEITQTGITGCVATVTTTYPNADISGTEASIHSAQLNGTFNQTTNPWVKFSALGANTLTATGATIPSGQTSYFTGIRGANPTATIVGGGVSICVGGSAALNTNVTGDGPFTYSWSPAAGLSATNIANPVASPIITTPYTVSVRDGNGILVTDNTTITVNPAPPTPNVTPAGPVIVCEGSANIVLTSDAATGNQWYKDGSPIGGETATTLNITTTPANSGSYAVISTVSSCSSAVSNAVAVTINALPLTTPVVAPATTTVCSGSTVTVNIAGSQAGINYELFDGVTSLSSPVAGTGGAINIISTPLTANTTITVRATNPTTLCTTLLGGTSVVTVTPIPPAPNVTPAGPVIVCEGSANIVLTSDAATGNQWYKDGSPIGGATATTLNITTTPANSGSYTVISTVSSCSSAVSNAVAVTINALPLTTPVVAPATTTVCSGSTVTVNIAGSQAGINYELFDGVTSLSSPVAGTGGAINIVTSALTANTTITVRATNPTTTCTVLLSGTSVVTVTPIPPAPTVTPAGPVIVCEGSANIVLTSDAATGNQWYKDGSPIGGETATTLNITTTPANTGSYTVISTVSSCSSAVSNAVAITINALPLTTPVVTPATPTICSGSTVTVNIAGSQAGINYELFDGVTSLSSPVAGTGGAINIVTSALTANTTITVRATNPTTTCTVLLSGTSVVTVTPIPPTPNVTPAGPVIVCEGSANIVLTSNAATGNQWYKDGSPIGGATATTLNITTTPANSGSYTVISTVSSCSSAVSNAVAITINALPLTTPVVTPATPTICSGSTVTVNIAGSQAGINYELFDGVTSLSSPVAGTGGAINIVTSALTANTTITVRATNPTTSCTTLLSGTSVVTVTPIPPTPNVTPAGPVIVCEGSANIVLTSDAATGNQWYKDGSPIGGETATTLNITTTPANSGSYTVISTVSSCSSAVSNAVAVTINALPLTTPVVAPATTTVCSGSTVTVNIAGSQAGINYELFDGVTSLSSPVAGTGGAINIVTSALTANTTITVRATNPTTTCTVLLSGTSVVTVTPIPPAPTVTPAGPVIVCEGSANIVLTSDAATGNQWYKDGSPIGGATATTLNITTAPANSGSYTVISTVSSCSSAVSNAVAVTINALPLTTPVVAPATTTICSGSTVTVNIAGSQAGINYELFDGVTSLSSPVAGTGGAINIVTSALTANTTITVRATNPTTLCTVLLSGTSVVTVTPIPPAPNVTPAGPVIVCEGSANIVLTSDAATGNQWYKDGSPIGGATATTLNITTTPANSGSYTVISTVSSCSSAVSNAVAITINALPLTTPVVAPATTTICSGSTVTVNIAGSQAGINYELFDGVTSLSSPVAGTGGAINIISTPLTANTTIAIRATNPTTLCTVLLSGTSVVTVTPIPPAPTVTPAGPVIVCEGSANIVLTSDAATGNQWYKDGSPIGGATATTLNITTNPANSGSYTVISTVSSCASAVSNAVAVTINALPLTTPVVAPATTTVCSGSTVTVNIAGSQAGINYELFDGVTSLSSPVAGTGGAINIVTSALTANTTITVRATNPTTNCTTLLSGTSVVTVTPIPPAPNVTPAGPVIVCEGSANIVLTSDAATGNQWYKDGSPIGGATATTLNITTNPANSGSYTVISTVSSCASAVSNAVAVTINALPLTTPVVAPATTTVCSGSTVTVNIAGSQAGINYELFDGVTSLSSPVAGTGGAINIVTSALTANTTITVRATNPTTLCTVLLSGTSVVTVTPIPPAPNVTPAGPVIVCEGSANIVLTSDAATGNQWYKDGSPIGGETATTLNITTNPANSGNYTVISTVSSCASAVSNAVAITINALPLTTPVVTPATPTICSGSTVTVNIAGSQAGINYELFDGVTSLSSPVAGTGGAINIVTSALTANTTITVRATNPTTLCTTLLSGTSVVTVTPIPPAPNVTPAGPVIVCEGSANIVLTSDAATGNQWYKDGSPIGGATATTLNITTTPANSGSYTVISTVSSCSSAVSNAVAVTINALPFNTPGVSPINTIICSGSTVTVNIIGTEPGINYTLYDGGTPVSVPVAGTGGSVNLISTALVANTVLTVEAQNPLTGCSIILPGTTTVTVSATIPTPVIVPAGSVTACVGDPVVILTSNATSGNQWYKDGVPIPGETNQTLSISTGVVNSGSYTVYEIQGGCTSAASLPVNVTIHSIASPPVVSNPNPICVGGAIPSLTASGTSIQWYSDAGLTTLVGTGSPFTPSSSEVDNLTAGSYFLYVTQTIGCESSASTVTVVVNAAIVADAGADSNLCVGQSITLGGSPSAVGGNGTYTYSWTSSPPGFTSTQSNPVVTPTLGATSYILQVTDAFGCTNTDQIDITVNEVPTFTVTNNSGGGSGQICSGSTIAIALASPNVGATITLQPVTYGGSITGGLYAAGGNFVNGNTVTEGGGLTNTSNIPVTIIYTFSVATPDCTNPITQQATVVVNPTPVLTITNSTPSICSNSAVSILLNSPTSGAVIRITSVNYGSVTGGTLSTGSTFTPGSSITESLINPGNNPVTVRYNLEVLANGCTTSGYFTDVVVNPNPTFIATNLAPQICHADQTSIFFGSVTAGHQINVVNVFYGGVTGGTVNPGVTTFNSAIPLQETLFNLTNSPIDVEYTFNVTTPATTPVCPLTPVSQTVTVRVYPNPTFTTTNNSGGGTGTICSGQQSNILLNTPISGGQVRLASVTYGAVSGSYSAGALFANGQSLSETLINNTGSPVTVNYEFEAIVSSCTPSASQVVSVVVNPAPDVVALPASQTICSGANTNIALSTTNGVAGASYSWTVVQSGVSGATADTGATINQTLTATGSTAGTATYTITPTAGGCNGTPITVIVTVNPLPDVLATPNAESICSGATTNIALSTTNGVVGATYSWTVVQSNVSGATSGFGTSINQTLTATTSTSGTATYTITPAASGCNGTPIIVVVTVNPAPDVVALPASQTICSGANTNIALSTTNGVAGASYSWTVVQSGVSGATADTGATINQTLTGHRLNSRHSYLYDYTNSRWLQWHTDYGNCNSQSVTGCAGHTKCRVYLQWRHHKHRVKHHERSSGSYV
jgi:autotransporter-associated beta strand protein